MVQAEIGKNVDPRSLQINSSTQTIGSLINQMVGGTMLVLPLLFQKGIVSGTINMIITGFISAKANLIYVEHLKLKEMDYQNSISRILGKNYKKCYQIVKWTYLFFIVLIYFTLITIQLYSIIQFILASAHVSEKYYVPTTGDHQSQWQLDKFCIPYMTLISLVICWGLISVKDLTLLIKIAGYGVWTIISFCIFILALFFYSLFYKGTHYFGEKVSGIQLISSPKDIESLAGTAAMAFAVQINSCSAVKCNKVQENNQRDVILTYIAGGFIYEMIGILGSLGIQTLGCKSSKPDTITDCFDPTNIATLVVIIIYISHLLSAFPIYYNLTKKATVDLFFKGKMSNRASVIFDASVLIFFAIVQNSGLKLDDLMSLNGAVCCFFYVYLIPLMMDIACYHGENKLMVKIKKSMSRIGLMKTEDGKRSRIMSVQSDKHVDIRKNKLEQYNKQFRKDSENLNEENRPKFNSKQNNNDIKESLLSNDSGAQSENNLEYQKPRQYQTEVLSNVNYAKQAASKYDKSGQNQSQQIQKNSNYDEEENHYQSCVSQQDGDDDDSDNESEEVLERAVSCNFHDIDDSNKTAKIIIYSIIGFIGLSLLIFEIVLVISQIVKVFEK